MTSLLLVILAYKLFDDDETLPKCLSTATKRIQAWATGMQTCTQQLWLRNKCMQPSVGVVA